VTFTVELRAEALMSASEERHDVVGTDAEFGKPKRHPGWMKPQSRRGANLRWPCRILLAPLGMPPTKCSFNECAYPTDATLVLQWHCPCHTGQIRMGVLIAETGLNKNSARRQTCGLHTAPGAKAEAAHE